MSTTAEGSGPTAASTAMRRIALTAREGHTGMPRRTRAVLAIVAGSALVAVFGLVAVPLVQSRGSSDIATRNSVSVPVMWVERGDDGALSGGVSTVDVTARHAGSSARLVVDLNDSGTGATGTAWNASSASAAAIAMLYSGQDPRGIEVTFRVDDAIDGSSAGTALAVGVLAALRGDQLRPGVTVTGTISPDGSVGAVDGIEAKVRGAAAAGYTDVMVPTASTASAPSASPSAATSSPTSSVSEGATSTPEEQGSTVDVASLSRELGIHVWSVSTLGQAYAGFTGHEVAAPAASPPGLDPAFLRLVDGQVWSAQAALAESISAADENGAVTAEQASTAKAQLALSRQRAMTGDLSGAYAAAVGALIVVDQLAANASAAAMIDDDGTASAAAAQIERAREQAGRADKAMASASAQAVGASPVQQIAAVTALTELAKSVAVLRTISGELDSSGGTVDSQVLEAAAVNAQYHVVIERIFPDSLALGQALQASPSPRPGAMAAFMSAYADLLSSAGSANQRYYEEVLTSIARSPDLTFSQPGHLYGAVQELQALSSADSAIPSVSAIPSENVVDGNYIAACAWDFAYYTMSAYLVSAEQAYGLAGTGIGNLAISAENPGALGVALASGTGTVASYSAQLASYGLDPDHALWAAQSGNAMAGVGAGTKHETASVATGLQTMWDGAIESFMGNAAHRALVVGASSAPVASES